MAIKSFNLRMPPPMHAAVRERAWLRRMSMTTWIQKAIGAALECRAWPRERVDISIPQILARHLGEALTENQIEELMQELKKGG